MLSADVYYLVTDVRLVEKMDFIFQGMTEDNIDVGIPMTKLMELILGRTRKMQPLSDEMCHTEGVEWP